RASRLRKRIPACQTGELRRLGVGRIGCDIKLDRYAESCERRRVIQSLTAHTVPQPDRIHFPNARLAVLRHDENSPVGTTRTVSRKKLKLTYGEEPALRARRTDHRKVVQGRQSWSDSGTIIG